nr:hypothetical protein CFP56_02378 [Quercus suber]
MPATKEVHVDPIAVVDPSSDDDVGDPIVTPPLSLCAMMESFMITKAAHGQFIDELLTKVATLRTDLPSLEVSFHLLHPLMLDGCLWQFVTKGGNRF